MAFKINNRPRMQEIKRTKAGAPYVTFRGSTYMLDVFERREGYTIAGVKCHGLYHAIVGYTLAIHLTNDTHATIYELVDKQGSN